MFRIPLKIGKNNEIEESSDLGSLTDRGDTFRSGLINRENILFEEDIGGLEFNIF